MLSIANKVDPLISCCVCFVCDTNYVFPTTAQQHQGWLGTTKLYHFPLKLSLLEPSGGGGVNVTSQK